MTVTKQTKFNFDLRSAVKNIPGDRSSVSEDVNFWLQPLLGSDVNLKNAPIIKILRAQVVEIKEHFKKHINDFLSILDRLTDR